MAVELVLAGLLAWLATAAIHGGVLVLAASALSVALARALPDRAALAAARERLWKLAIFGGLATATLALASGRAWRIEVPGIEKLRTPAPLDEAPLPARTPDVVVASPASPAGRIAWESIPWIELAAGAWLAGVAGGAVLWMRDRKRLAVRLRGRARARTGPALELFARLLRASPGAGVALSRAPGLTAPITRGLFRPEICIPPRAEKDLLDEEIEAMLAHELAHARRHDPLLLSVCRAVEILFFFQPLFRFARLRLQEEIEILCDDRAASWTGDPASLASCLAEVATWIVAGSPETRAVAITGRRSRLERRVFLLLERRDPRLAGRGRWLFAPAACALVAAGLPLPAIAMRAAPNLEVPAAVSTTEAVETAAERFPEWPAMRGLLSSLEAEYSRLLSSPGLARASQDLRVRLVGIGARLRSLRAMQAEVDSLIAEEVSAERQPER